MWSWMINMTMSEKVNLVPRMIADGVRINADGTGSRGSGVGGRGVGCGVWVWGVGNPCPQSFSVNPWPRVILGGAFNSLCTR